MYEYLPTKVILNHDGILDTSCSNHFSEVSNEEVAIAEKELGYEFPSELKQFYKEIGYCGLTTPKNPFSGYSFF